MSYSYTITVGATTFTPSDMEKIIDSSTLKIVKPFCSTKKTSGTGTMSVVAKGAADPTFYQTFMVALLGAQQAQEVNDCQIVVNKDSTAVFRGYLDLSTIQINSAKLPQDLTLSANDKSILLDKKIRLNKAWENQTRSTIISDIISYLGTDYGTSVSLLSNALPSSKKIKRYAVAEGKEQTYREVIDKILLESAGYVLWYDPEYDGFRVMAIQTDLTGLTPRVIEYLVKNQLQTKSAIYEKDGVLLSFPNVVERKKTNIYTENISVSIDDNNYVIGQDIPSGHYFPSDGDIKEIYQQYRVPDRPYISHESRLQNEDLKLIYCKDVEYSIQSNPKLNLAPALPNVKWTGTPEYYPDRARLLFINNNPNKYFPSEDTSAIDAKDYYIIDEEGNYVLVPSHTPADNPKALGWYEAEGANLSAFSITGTAVYESYLNKVTVGRLDPDANGVPCTNPEEYKADTIQYMNGDTDFSEAINFAKWYYKSLNYGQTISQWTEYPGVSHLGEVVYVAHKMTGIMMPHIVVQITDESVDGSRVRCNRVVAISIYGWEEYVYDNGITADGNNGTPTQRANRILTGNILVGTTTCRGVAGIVGDIYINDDEESESFGNMYKCIVAGTAFTAIWEYQANIKGKDASVVGLIYEIEYGLSTSDSEFVFPEGTYGYDSEHTYGYDSENSYGFKDYAWSPTLEGWYHGLYVWQRIKITDADGNITYEDPTYAAELTQSLSDSCIIELSALPDAYTSNLRRTDSQYLFLNLKDIGYRGTLILRTDIGVFASYNESTEEWTDLTNALTIILNGTSVLTNYGIKLPYAMDSNVTIQGDFEEWTLAQFSIPSLSICPSIEKNIAIQLETVDTYADLPTFVNKSSQDASINDNLIKGDYILVKFLTLTATSTTQATDETGKIWNITELSSYYDSNLDPISISAFVTGNTYYAFAVYAWMYNGVGWTREATAAIEIATVKEAVGLAQTQYDIDPTVDYHRCLYAHQILVEKLTAGVINVGNIFVNDIESTNYTEDADGTPTTGYKLIHNGGEDGAGEIKSVGGVYANMNVRGALRLWKNNNVDEVGADIEHPALTTISETIAGDPTGVAVANSPIAWSSDRLLSAVSSLTRNNIATAGGSFKSKNLARYVYADNLSVVLRASETVSGQFKQSTSYPNPQIANPYTFSIPYYVKNPIQVTFEGGCSIGVNSDWSVRSLGTVSISVNGSQVYSKTATGWSDYTYSYTATLYGGDSVSISATYGEGLFNRGRYADTTFTIPTIFLYHYVDSIGFWLEYSDGSMEKFASGQYYTDRMQMSSPVSFDSNNYKVLNNCANFINYWSFTDAQSVYHTLKSGITYSITSSELYVLGNEVTGKYLTRNTSSVVLIYEHNGTRYSLEMASGSYYQAYGTIKIAETSTKGVKMMGNYPKRDADDPEGGFDCGNSAYKWDNGYFKTIHYQSLGNGSRREIKDDIVPYNAKALDILNSTEIVRYVYKSDKNKTPKIGFIADDTHEDIAGLQHDRMELDHCVAVLIKAVQELSAEINRLKGGNN